MPKRNRNIFGRNTLYFVDNYRPGACLLDLLNEPMTDFCEAYEPNTAKDIVLQAEYSTAPNGNLFEKPSEII